MRTHSAEPRRYLAGNTALTCIRDAPYLRPENMVKISPENREKAFRGVKGSDKYGNLVKDSDSEGEEEKTEVGEFAGNTTDENGLVVWYWVDHHPKVYCQLMWENRSQVLVSFTPGSGLVIRTAIPMGLEVLAVANTPGHMEVLQAIVKQFIRG